MMPYLPDMDPSQTVAPRQSSWRINDGRSGARARRWRVWSPAASPPFSRFWRANFPPSRTSIRKTILTLIFWIRWERPDNAANPSRNMAGTFNSRLCCTNQDTVKVDYEMVVPQGEKYPEPEWYVWIDLDGTGVKRVRVPPEKIVEDYAPTGQAYAFVLGNTIQCFVRPQPRA